MRYRFHVHKHAASWRMVLLDGAPPPSGCQLEDWQHTRTREADDTNADIRREVAEQGYSLFKLGGDFAAVAADAAALGSAHSRRAEPEPERTTAAAKSLARYPVHLGLGATAQSEPEFTGDSEWFDAYGARHAADGTEGRLVSMFTFASPWDAWEMHPRGSELVLCTAGEIILIQEMEQRHVRTRLQPGQYAINAPGVWHTADATSSATAVFVTSGLGTQHRPR